MNQSGGRKAQKQDRFLRGRQIAYLVYEYFRVTGANDSVENFTDLFTISLRNDDIRNSTQSGTEFYCPWRKSHLTTSWKHCTNFRIRESEKLKTVLELYNVEIHQKKAGPDYHRLKTMVKRSIEQNLRIKKFEARNGNYERNAAVKNQGTKQRGQRIPGDCWQWKANGQCVKGDNSSFRHDINKRGKLTQSSTSPRSFMRQNERNASRTRSPSGRMSWWPCKDYLKGTCTNSFCEKWHPPECLFYKSESGCRLWEKCSHAHRQVDEQPSKRSKKNGDKSAVALLKKNEQNYRTERPVVHDYWSNTRELGCVFHDLEPPKSSSILRKSSDIRKPIQRVQITKAVVRQSDIRDQNPSLGMICPGSSWPKLQRSKIWGAVSGRRSSVEAGQSVLKLKEHERATFFSPSEK